MMPSQGRRIRGGSVAIALFLGTIATAQLAAQDGLVGTSEEVVAEPVQDLPFSVRFWQFLVRQNYKNWAPMPGKTDGTYEGESPHGASMKIYASRNAAGNPEDLPHGSILVTENYAADKKTLESITVMYRSRGFDPAHLDWYWARYNADGSVARTTPDLGSRLIAGKVESCVECHRTAAGNDYVFANDPVVDASLEPASVP